MKRQILKWLEYIMGIDHKRIVKILTVGNHWENRLKGSLGKIDG